MKIVIAMDSFKGCLSARDACAAVSRGILKEVPRAELVLRPMADGGEGTARTVLEASAGQWISLRVTGPLPSMRVDGGYAWLPDAGPAALVEMAAASGLPLLRDDQRDPMRTTTYGTGELLVDAVRRGARRIWLAVGGSATVDCGVGAASALGWRFLDASGEQVGPGGAGLHQIVRIERPPDLELPPVEVLCDVDNPLTGPHGAARVFGPQKGATATEVDSLDAALGRFAATVREELGVEIESLPGAGAAGGLAGGAVAFMGASLVPGVDAVMRAINLFEAVTDAAWVVTGEGAFDSQSLHGKVVSGVARAARTAGSRVAVIAGAVNLAPELAYAEGIDAVLPSTPGGMPLETALQRADELLVAAGRRFARESIGAQ